MALNTILQKAAAPTNKYEYETVHGGGGVRRADTSTLNPGVSYTSGSGSTPTTGAQNVINYSILKQDPSLTNNASSSGSASTANPYSGYADQLASLYAQQQSSLSAYQQQMAQAAQNAYNQNYSALSSAYNNKLANLENSLNNAKSQLTGQYDYAKGNIQSDSLQALQQAYINRMLGEKNINQQLTAQGLSGGASESVRASMLNNYGNARNQIDDTRLKNMAGLEQTYNTNLSDVLNNYYNAKSSAEEQNLAYRMQLENALANNQISSLGDYMGSMASIDNNYTSAVQRAIESQANFNAQKYFADNEKKNSTSTSDRSSLIAQVTPMVKQRYSSGESTQSIYEDLTAQGYSPDEIYQMFTINGIDVTQ